MFIRVPPNLLPEWKRHWLAVVHLKVLPPGTLASQMSFTHVGELSNREPCIDVARDDPSGTSYVLGVSILVRTGVAKVCACPKRSSRDTP